MSLVRTQWSFVVTFAGLFCVNQVSGQSDSQNRNHEIGKNAGFSRVETSAKKTHTSKQPVVDGTWREDGRYIIIKLNGQELRLLKSQPDRQGSRNTERIERTSFTKQATNENEVRGAIVDGKMLGTRKPLANCLVTLIPLRRTWNRYVANETAEKYSATTSSSGEYRFVNVVPGQYKLFWRPQGAQQWIRRLRFKPEVVVRDNRQVHVKTIRSALRTLN